MVMYHNCGGERMASYIRSVGRTMFADVPRQELLDFHYRVMDYAQEKPLAEIPKSGLSSDYVFREAKRAARRSTAARPSSGRVSISTFPPAAANSKSTPEGTGTRSRRRCGPGRTECCFRASTRR